MIPQKLSFLSPLLLLPLGCSTNVDAVGTRTKALTATPESCPAGPVLPVCRDGAPRQVGDILFTDHGNEATFGLKPSSDPENPIFYVHSTKTQFPGAVENGDLIALPNDPTTHLLIGNTDAGHIGVAALNSCGFVTDARWGDFNGLSGPLGAVHPRGMAFDPQGLDLWIPAALGANSQTLYSVSPAGGPVSEITATGPSVNSGNQGAVAFDAQGNMYQADGFSAAFTKTNAATLADGAPVSESFPLSGPGADAVEGVTDLLATGGRLVAVSGARLFSIDLGSGHTTELAEFENHDIGGATTTLKLHGVTVGTRGDLWVTFGPAPGVACVDAGTGAIKGTYLVPQGASGPSVSSTNGVEVPVYRPWGIAVLGKNLPVIEDRCATSPTPTAQLTENPGSLFSGAEAGRSVATNGTYALFGSYRDGDPLTRGAGSAYLYKVDKIATGAVEQKFTVGTSVTINKHDGTTCTIGNTEHSQIGAVVSLSDEWAAVSANFLGDGFRGTGNIHDFWGDCGAAQPVVFLARRNGSGTPFSDLTLSIPVPNRARVQTLALSDDRLVMGTEEGAHIFAFDGSQWALEQTLHQGFLPSDSTKSSRFGMYVASSGSRIIVGDPEADLNGHIYVFEKENGQWTQIDRIEAVPDGVDWNFGGSVDIDGDHLVVGAKGSQFKDGISYAYGAVEMFELVGGRLRGVSINYDLQPHTVAISGNKIVAGGAPLLGTVPFPEGAATSLFELEGNKWTKRGAIRGVDDLHSGRSPWSPDVVDISGGTIVAGWRGYEIDNDLDILGALITDHFPTIFDTLPVLDDAESTAVWKNAGEYPWTRHFGSTGSYGTGPTDDANGSGHYYYVETSFGAANGAGNTASLESELFNPADTSLTFDYHMLGSDIGTLYVDIQIYGTWITNFWSRDGGDPANLSAAWQSASYDLSAFSVFGDVQVRLRYKARGGYQGDVALDNIRLTRN